MNKDKIMKYLPYVAFVIMAYFFYAYMGSSKTETPVAIKAEAEIDSLVATTVADDKTSGTEQAGVEPTAADISQIQDGPKQLALIADYSAKILANNDDADSYYRRAVIYQNTKQYSMAINDYTQVLRIMPQSANAYFNRGIVQTARKDFVNAITDFDSAIKLSPNDPNMYNARGSAYFSKNEVDKSIEDFKKAIELDPKFDRAYYNLGTVYDKQSLYKDALAQYDNAILFHVKDDGDANDQADLDRLLEAYYRRSLVKLQLADYAAALTDINYYIENDNKSAKAFRLRAAIYAKMGNTAAASDDENSAQNVGFEEMLH